jgi:hypothetical protein
VAHFVEQHKERIAEDKFHPINPLLFGEVLETWDYPKASWAWDTVLEPHRRASSQPEAKINVVYGDAEGDFEIFARSFRATQMLEAVAQRAAADYAWPAPFNMEMQSCGSPDAVWMDKTRTLRICYDLAFDFAQLYRAYVPAGPAPASTNQKRKKKSK